MRSFLLRFESAVESWMRRFGVAALQIALGAMYLWLGALKLFGDSPLFTLTKIAFPMVPPGALAFTLGSVEIAIGAALLLPTLPLPRRLEDWSVRAALLLLFTEAAAIVAAALSAPLAFFAPSFPTLSVFGDFLVRQFVLVAAAMVIAGHVRARDEGDTPPSGGV